MANRIISIDTAKANGTQLPTEVRIEVSTLATTQAVAGQLLAGDTAAPGINKYYGTDGSAVRGYYTLPTGLTGGGGGGGGGSASAIGVDNGDGTTTVSGVGVIDNGDGTIGITGVGVISNGDGTITVPATTNSVYTTATRPSAAAAGNGAQIYDSTLNIPIWSDGTVWRNAAGTVV